MSRTVFPLLAAAILTACSSAGDGLDRDARDRQSERSDGDDMREALVVFQTANDQNTVPLAVDEAKFGSDNGCLVIEVGGASMLPVFLPGGNITATVSELNFGNTTVALGRVVTVSGGARPHQGNGLNLIEAEVDRCGRDVGLYPVTNIDL